jgi:hypothetical protein
MGLELVELILAVEERFEIHIPDKDAARLNNTRKLIDYVSARVSLAGGLARECASQRAFYTVRKGLMAGGTSRSAVLPNTPLVELLPPESRRSAWHALERQINVPHWPELHRSDLVPRFTWYAGLTAGAAAAIPILRAMPSGTGLLVAMAAILIGIGFVHWTTRPFALHFSPIGLTAGDLSKLVASRQPVPSPPYTREEVAAVVRALVTLHLGVASFTDDDDFVTNLGAG